MKQSAETEIEGIGLCREPSRGPSFNKEASEMKKLCRTLSINIESIQIPIRLASDVSQQLSSVNPPQSNQFSDETFLSAFLRIDLSKKARKCRLKNPISKSSF